MNQDFDSFGLYEPPSFILCNPNGEQLYSLGSIRDRKYMPRYNSLGSISFIADAYINGEKVEYYDYLEYRRLIYLEGLGYFMITEPEKEGDGIVETKTITAESLEVELVTKKITGFKGTYKFYDLFNPSTTLIGTILTYLPGWSVGHIDASLLMLYRTFNESDSTIYNFLMQTVETTYQCVFDFDTINKTISAYTTEGATTNTDIYLSYDNLIKNINIKEKTDELITALTVYGGGNLSINQVNPLGTNTIYNFSHFKSANWMSQSLVDAITIWENKVVANQASYASLLTDLQNDNAYLITKESELVELQATFDSLEGVKSVRIQQGLNFSDINSQLATQQGLIDTKNAEITALEATITSVTAQLTAINTDLSFTTNFTQAQLTELSPFVIGSTYNNENFIQTDIMSVVEIQAEAQSLYDQAIDVLAKISQPRYEFTVESANFIFTEVFKPFIDQLVLGAVVTLELEDGSLSYPVLLGFDLNYDDPTDFSLIFGNRLRLDDSSYILSDLFDQMAQSAISTSFNSEQWSSWGNNYKDAVSSFITSALDAATNNIVSGSGQNILINQNGIRVRQSTGTNSFSPNQLWMNNGVLAFSDDGFETSRLALGQISTSSGSYYGLVAEVIVGNLVASNQLLISNQNNTFIVDGAGATLYDASFTLTKSDGNSKIILDPNVGIVIQKRASSGSFANQLYIDTSGNLIFAGNISGASGTFSGQINASSGDIGGWHINPNGLYDDNGNYIRSDGKVQLGKLWIDGGTAIFSGNFYADNLLGLLDGSHLKNINADTITAGTIRGINLVGSNIYWAHSRMYESGTGVSTIDVDSNFSLSVAGMAGTLTIGKNFALLYHQNQVTIGNTATYGSTKINLNGYVYSAGEKGASGTFPVGSGALKFTNGILTGTTVSGSSAGMLGNAWILSNPTAGEASGVEYNFLATDAFVFGKVGRVNSIGGVSLASNTTIGSSNCFVMYVSQSSTSYGRTGHFLLYGVVTSSAWSWAIGGLIYLGTGGNMTQSVPTGTDVVAQVLGVAIASNKIFFNPSLVQVEML